MDTRTRYPFLDCLLLYRTWGRNFLDCLVVSQSVSRIHRLAHLCALGRGISLYLLRASLQVLPDAAKTTDIVDISRLIVRIRLSSVKCHSHGVVLVGDVFPWLIDSDRYLGFSDDHLRRLCNELRQRNSPLEFGFAPRVIYGCRTLGRCRTLYNYTAAGWVRARSFAGTNR